MPPSDAAKRRKFRYWVKSFVGISATVSLVLAASQGRIVFADVLLYAAFIYILTTFKHPIGSNVTN